MQICLTKYSALNPHEKCATSLVLDVQDETNDEMNNPQSRKDKYTAVPSEVVDFQACFLPFITNFQAQSNVLITNTKFVTENLPEFLTNISTFTLTK
jgi:hypothetical protein